MAADESKKETGAAADPTQTLGATKVVWDDSNMRSVYANATNVAGGQEEIILLFGMNQSWQAGQKEIRIQLSDRIVLSPFAAKRLATVLNRVLANYEAQYGSLEIEARRSPTATVQ